jgi:hypothetical protein
MAGAWHFPKNKTDCSLDINRHRFTMRQRANSAFWFVAYASHTLFVYRNACLGRIYASHGMTKLCIRRNRSLYSSKVCHRVKDGRGVTLPQERTDCSLDINRHRFTMWQRTTSIFLFAAYAGHALTACV